MTTDRTMTDLGMSSIIDTDVFLQVMRENINKDLLRAAQPVLDEALESIEKELRKKLGSIVISMIDSNFNIDRHGSDIRILVRQERQ